MRLDGPESDNVEDRRGESGRGGGFRFPLPGGGGGGGRIGVGVIIVVLIGAYFGVDLTGLLTGEDIGPTTTQQAPMNPGQARTGQGQAAQGTAPAPAGDDAQKRFAARILGETERVWTAQFRQMGRGYQDPTLVLYSGYTHSGCGAAQAQTGPFYCPNDQRVYIDLDFMRQLQQRLGAQGDFASAYIIAHEVGHHVQNELGILNQARTAQQQATSEAAANQIQVRVELQADCFAGVWANQANQRDKILEDGDIEQGLNAAAAVGDDRLQRQARGSVQPETFTHGSSAQRVSWFRRGLQAGSIQACDTFGAQRP